MELVRLQGFKNAKIDPKFLDPKHVFQQVDDGKAQETNVLQARADALAQRRTRKRARARRDARLRCIHSAFPSAERVTRLKFPKPCSACWTESFPPPHKTSSPVALTWLWSSIQSRTALRLLHQPPRYLASAELACSSESASPPRKRALNRGARLQNRRVFPTRVAGEEGQEGAPRGLRRAGAGAALRDARQGLRPRK
eukprot:3325722-Pleurochrysis_carterae.AAC.1